MAPPRRVFQRLLAALAALAVVVSCEATSVSAGSGLFGGTWLVEDIAGRGVIDYAQSTISFDPDGTVSGSGGCNRFRGSATIEGNALTFGPLAATKKACVPALLDQEQKFFAGLADVQSFRLKGPYLFLDDAAGTPRLKFTRLE